MLKRTKYFLLVFLCIQFAVAGQWHQTYNDPAKGAIHDISSLNGSGDLYAAGDNGQFFRSYDQGQYWNQEQLNTTRSFYSVTALYFGPDKIIIAAGEHGVIARNMNDSPVWSYDSVQTKVNLRTVFYDYNTSQVWAAGDSGVVLSSSDGGVTWFKQTNGNPGLFAKKIDRGNNFAYMVGVKNDSSFVVRLNASSLTIAPGDTFPGIKLNDIFIDGINSDMYLAGNAVATQNANIFKRTYNGGYSFPALLYDAAGGKATAVGQYTVGKMLQGSAQAPVSQILWFADDQGVIHETIDQAASWQDTYKDPQNLPFYTMFINPGGQGAGQALAVAAGMDMNTVINNFELINVFPNQNDVIDQPLSRVELNFSAIPDLATIQDSILIRSNLSGSVPYFAEYDSFDSLRIYLNLSRVTPNQSVPGEKWQINIPASIRELHPNIFQTIAPRTINSVFVPYNDADMDYQLSPDQLPPSKMTTNIVSGFFDSDGAPDLAAFISDSLVIYRTDGKGSIVSRTAIFLGFTIVPNVSNSQLLKTDLNNDGKPDLLVYDNTHIYSAINQSGTSFIFNPGPSLAVNNLRQVALFDADNNSRPDMLVLNDSLYYRADISGAGLGTSPVYIDFGNSVKSTLNVADINNDGREDIFGILNDGNFYFQAYQGFGGFSPMYSTTGANFYTSARAIQSYSNGDHRMQVLVVASSEITMFEVDQTDQSRMVTTPNSPIMQATPDIITDIQVQDFGSNPGNITHPGQVDFVLHVQTGAFKFFENSSQNNNGYTYTERPSKEVMGQPTETNMLVWDSDENGYLDVLEYDPNKGSFSNLLNQAWGPQITNLSTEPGGVRIDWTGFDPVHGSFDFYRVWRDSTGPEMSAAQQIAYLTNSGDSTFLDTHTQPFMNYWYRVETGYNGNQVSNPSQTKEIQLIKILSGALSGVLADTINGQYVPDSASVPGGQSLNIMPGVHMAFGNKAYLNVFGQLNVQGSNQQMVEFTNERHDTVNTIWNGITLYPAADTVRFNWFSISGADTGIKGEGRPLWMKLGGLDHNKQGAAFRGDSVHFENVVFDSNYVGLSIGEGARALLKNILAVDNSQTGVHLEGVANVHIRNAVMWFNGVQDLEIIPGPTVSVGYSSIEKTSIPITGKEINQSRAPAFVPGADFYRPDPFSPTVDAGDPADDFSFEPAPNGGRINQGVYGGTFLATISDRPHLVVTPSPINYNGALVGSMDTIQVSFQNDGTVALDISSIFIAQHNDVFNFLQQPPASIAPASNVVIDLVFAPTQALSYNDTLFVDSNDPANPHFGVKINAFALNQNKPPIWNGLSALAFTEDQAEVKINLLPFVVDDLTPLENLIFGLVSNSDTTHIHGRVQDSLLIVDLNPDYFTKTPQQIILSAEDADGLVSNDTIEVSVAGIQDAPRFVAMPDTVIYTNVVFDTRWYVHDVDGDTVHISDNTSLFTINPDSGFIKFTPLVADTGSYSIILTADDGYKSVSDTFAIQIKLNTIAPVLNLSLTPQDQAMDIAFDMPVNDFYTGTIVRYSSLDTVFSPNGGILAVDSAFSVGSSVRLRINSLEINRQYFVSVFNFFQSAGTIYSEAIRSTSVTLAPFAQVDTSGTKTNLPVNKALTKSILLKNMGGGTLIARFAYHPDSLTNVWFSMDTIQKTVGPGDSIKVGYSLHPNKKLPRGAKVVFIDFSSNEPGNDGGMRFPIVLQPIFDDFAPHVLVTARSDSLLRESAFNLHYYLDDTTGYPIGEPDSGLFAHYRLFRLNPTTLIEEKDSIQSNILQFYPLEDGAYVLRIFGYDVDGNGQGGQLSKNIGFLVDNNHRRVLRNHWYMINVPRPVSTHWTEFIPDSTAQIYRWKQDEERYLPLRSYPDLVFSKGMAVWAISNNAFEVDISSMAQAALEDSLSVAINVGWNQIGAPLGYTTWWRDMQFVPGESATVLPLPQAVQQDLIGPAVYHYVDIKDKHGYLWSEIDTARAESWKGYWFYSKTAGHLIFSTKAADLLPQLPDVSQTVDGVLAKSSSISELRFSIALYHKGGSDLQNEFGLGIASPRSQILEPPAIGTQSTLYFSDASKHLARDMQPLLEAYDDVRTWQAVVKTGDVSGEHILRWDADMGSRQGIYLYLVDNHREQIVDMQKTAFYKFRPKTIYSRFEIYATHNANFKPVIVPASFTLKQNYPNPFNPSTHIRFGIPQSASGQRVQLQIYNTLGQQVAELINKPLQAGYHELIWNGVNLSGKAVASGLYFYKLTSGGNMLTRRMLLLR